MSEFRTRMSHTMNLFQRVAVRLYRLTILGMETGPHVSRYFMYRHLSRFRLTWPDQARALSISHSQRLGKTLGFSDAQILNVAYPEVSLLKLPFNDAEFDCVVSDQVFEHIQGNPQDAMAESLRVVKPGGLVLHTTCMLYPIHGSPFDFWRFTPEGLKHLVAGRAEVIDGGGWGNRFVWLFIHSGLLFEPIPNCRFHPANWVATRNNPEWPVVTWILAKRTA